MADTGAPWNLPYPLPTDLVRDGADDIKDLAEATADGLSAASGLVAVKQAIRTTAFSASAISAGANVAVGGLEITHEVADPANRLIITAYFGVAASSDQRANVGIAVAQDGTLISVGTDVESRAAVGAAGRIQSQGALQFLPSSVTFVHTPGAGEKTYTVRVVNVSDDAFTLYVNRAESDTNNAARPRSSSALVIQEVKV